MKTLRWFPAVVSLIGNRTNMISAIGKEHFREGRLAKRAYACEDGDGDLHYVESESQACASPSVKSFKVVKN